MKRLLSLSVLIAILWGCCNVEDTPKTDEKPANYIVTFDANGGKGTMPQQIFVADTPQPLNPNTFKRDGYVFTEWNTTADGKGVTYLSGSYYSLTSDIKLYAQWNAEEEKKEDEENPDNPEQTYSVTYKSQYGTVPNKISGLKKDDELTILQLQELVTTGYTFAGWYNGENEITTGHKITCDLELTAKWDVNTYTVVFYDNGGNGNMEYQNFTYNAEQALTANAFTREGYTFAGWATSPDGKAVYADKGKVKNLTAEDTAIVALYAVWTDNDKVLPVIFSQPTAVDYGDSITLSCATEGAKINYTIDGVTAEYTDAFPITKDVIITAFATKDGMKDSDMSIASYTVKTYRVTYRSEYGTEPDKIMGLKKGDTLTEEQLAGITAGGYTFSGWYNGENKIEAGYTITCDLELTAKWNANTYTVKFDANGGSGEMANQTFTYDVEQALTANTFTREGHTFAGWAKSTDGEIIYSNKGSVKNLTAENGDEVTLYAIWNEAGFVYVQGATITGAITANGYTTSKIFKDGRTVTVGDFYICDHEVTQAEYETYCSYGGDKAPSSTYGKGNNYPAYFVSWYDALVYCNKRSIAERLTPCYTISDSTNPDDWGAVPTSSSSTWEDVICDFTANGYRLPIEVEWEYAARGGNGLTGTQYTYAGSYIIDEVAWYESNSGNEPHTVKGKKANGLGLYDMSGNMSEWCWNTASSISTRRLRGGSWYHENDKCMVAHFMYNEIYSRYANFGFRVVRTIDFITSPIGCIAYSDGSISENYDNTKTPVGIVIEVSDEGVATKIVSLTETDAQWSTENVSTKATSTTDGKANMEAIQSIEGWEGKYPAFKWCDDYTDASGNSQWYLPAPAEQSQLYIVKEYVNTTIDKIIAGGGTATKLDIFYPSKYWSSSESNDDNAWSESFSGGNQDYGVNTYKSYTLSVRAVRAF